MRTQYVVRWNHMQNAWEVYDTVSRLRVSLVIDKQQADRLATELNRRAGRR